MNRLKLFFPSENGFEYSGQQHNLQCAIEKITKSIKIILSGNNISVYLFGSAVMNDFKLGWSDIDILCLTEREIEKEQAEKLVTLRQTLLKTEPENPYYRSFEGGILTLDAFLTDIPDRVVYWGTSGQRITYKYCFDSFSMVELLLYGKLLYGSDVREKMHMPTYEMLVCDVRGHYNTIRKYAVKVGPDIKSYGWLLDISRCIYTLRTGKVIAKTAAGEWALEKGVCPVADALEIAVMIHKEPLMYKNDARILNTTDSLGEKIQMYADTLKTELNAKN